MLESSFFTETSMLSASHNNKQRQQRVILLLDLDCFYAQCECVRLGFDVTTTPLALLQFNSALAVTYPARTLFSQPIERGDGWEAVRDKSGGKCYAVHVPLLPVQGDTTNATTTSLAETLQEEYDSLYKLSKEQQEEARKRDLWVRRFAAEGKASIECYRIASAKIFETVHEFLETEKSQMDDTNVKIMLERASIDEFYLDVTDAVNKNDDYWNVRQDLLEENSILQTTHLVRPEGEESVPWNGDVFRRACWLAHQLRQYVRNTLSFTMSCGISVNKTLAKLSAGYGKPNGQALLLPEYVEYMLEQTQIRKCRNLGGKVGAAVQSLLPQDVPTTVASIAKYLSMPQLVEGFHGDEATARWVYDVARGIDPQPVVAKNTGALTKTVTTFKSFTACPVGDTTSWIELLARDIVTRIEKDAHRNNRYPRVCTIQYHPTVVIHANADRFDKRKLLYQNKSFRTSFPPQRLERDAKVRHLVHDIQSKLLQHCKESTSNIDRLGIAASDFITIASCLDLFVQRGVSGQDGENLSKKRKHVDLNLDCTVIGETITPKQKDEDADRILAEKLQADFDRENRLLQASERLQTLGKKKNKTKRIESFFVKKK
ncbi:DNA polymerase eta [Fistulifera solaris]|uniref:DNA polymerase eta n=1 Tax=Fistulifera solaris TaxID=1519565 RepID=A0A1Z5J682_FISSO|nr:DNA polymerase eta [Fistulifera solaris]|eukprot:GAX09505.1 DNA polymerase eta [Fistulifera solaris]